MTWHTGFEGFETTSGIGYSASEAVDRTFGPFRYQQRGPLWDAVNAWLGSLDGFSDQAVLDAVEAAYASAVKHATI